MIAESFVMGAETPTLSVDIVSLTTSAETYPAHNNPTAIADKTDLYKSFFMISPFIKT